jgi:tetratricopeptide (TPR) repeat protein
VGLTGGRAASGAVTWNSHNFPTDVDRVMTIKPRWDDAARLLEQATRAGVQDAPALMLQALAYKHLGRTGEARQTLSKIHDPSADVFLQRGLLAFRDKQYTEAAADFEAALARDPHRFAAAYNLFLARLWDNKLDAARNALMAAQQLATADNDRRFLGIVVAMMTPPQPGDAPSPLAHIGDDEEQRLLDMFIGMGRFEVAYPMLSRLVAARPGSVRAFKEFFGAVLVQAKQFLDRNQWEEAKILLAPIRRRIDQHRASLDPFLLIALYQMLGVCSAMLQDFDQAVAWFRLGLDLCGQNAGSKPGPQQDARYFSAQGVPQLAMIEQNLALVHDWLGKPQLAEAHWKRYIDLLEANLPNSRPSDYLAILAFECVHRLSEAMQKQERWQDAIDLLQRAHRLRPTDYDTLEKLFNLYSQQRRQDEARRILRRMREVRPNDPQVELFELDVREVRSVEEIEPILQDLRRVSQKFPGDLRVDERTKSILYQLIPSMERFAEQFNGQVKKVVDQMRRLPSYQVNWPVVRDVMRDLEESYSQLRRAAQRMMSLASADDQRRDLQRLIAHCDRKIDQCASLGR